MHRLLSSFDYQHTRLTLSELSRRAGLPLSTTHRMVTEMVRLGMLERDHDAHLAPLQFGHDLVPAPAIDEDRE